MNKKGSDFSTRFTTIIIILTIIVLSFSILSHIFFKGEAKDKCQEIGLNLFDYDSGGLFAQSSITCINKTTNKTTKIR